MKSPLRVLVVGCGRMGASHAAGYHGLAGFEIAGLVSRRPQSREALNRKLGGGYRLFDDIDTAIRSTRPDVVSINTYPDTHEAFSIRALNAGCHVFLEKPAALTEKGCRRVIQAAKDAQRKLLVGYILRHHPLWIRFVETAQGLGTPLVMRMNLNRQSSGKMWERHKNLLATASSLVDSGVHYVDIMCWMTGAAPIRVSALSTQLSGALSQGKHNYGQLQVAFDDGSVGWYESGWGPMMSDTAASIRDVVGPRGSVSIVPHPDGGESLKIHLSELDTGNRFVHNDAVIEIDDAPDHADLCRREQAYLLKAIREDLDLSGHWTDVVNSQRIVLAADESIRTGRIVVLQKS